MGGREEGGRRLGLGKIVGPRGRVELSQLDLSFGPAENGTEAGVTGFLSPELGW